MNGSSGWRLSRRLEELVLEHQLDVSSLKMVALYQRDMWDHQGAYLTAQMWAATRVPALVVSGPFMQKLMPSYSQLDMVSLLKELTYTAPIAPVEIALSSSLMLVLCE
jgi:hypothetical protein